MTSPTRADGPAPASGAIPWGHALRDALLVAATLALWRADAALRADGGALAIAVAVAVAAGVMTAVAGYLAHEWGHFLGARAGGSALRLPASAREVFLFNFDVRRSTPRQFVLMSSGGFAASLAVIVLLVAVLPLPALSALVALGLTAAGVVATAVLEVPPFVRVLRGGPLPRGAAYVSEPAGTPSGER
jgi:hypothetical protein